MQRMLTAAEAEQHIIDVENARCAFGSVMGGDAGHRQYRKRKQQLQQMADANTDPRAIVSAVTATILAMGGRLKQ